MRVLIAEQNIISALKKGKETGLITVGLTGSKPSKSFSSECDFLINVPSDDTGRIQEAHIFIGHSICQYVEKKIFSSYEK